MNTIPTSEHNQVFDDEINFRDFFKAIWQGKILIVLMTSSFTILGILYALHLPNIYRSQALLAPSQEQESLSSAMRGLSGLAGLAGINLPDGISSKSAQAVEVLSSRTFFSEKIFPVIHLPDLMANPRWDPKTDSISYDNDLYDSNLNEWVRNVAFPYQVSPTPQEAFDHFSKHVLRIQTDSSTGFITLSIDHVSPFIARDWAKLIIHEINELFRDQDLRLALSSITYLNNQIAITSVVEVRQALSQLLQNQIQISMLTEANEDYVFATLDPPIPPELKNSPRRSLIVTFATFLGGILGIFFAIIKFYAWRKPKI